MSNDDKVGYRRPPKHTQFAKGHSGNPAGRPRGSKNLVTQLVEELGKRVEIKENGKIRHVTKQQVIVLRLVEHAAKGDPKAIQTTVALTRDVTSENAAPSARLSAADRAIVSRALARFRKEAS